MNILISNDDGIYAPGVRALAEALSETEHRITVVCPDRERSATGHALTLQEPLRVDQITGIYPDSIEAWACSGTPSDTVKLALDALLVEPPDLVLSGINRGANLGTDVLYSGTVSAAMEGVMEGLPSIAFSLASFAHLDFSAAANFAKKMVKAIAAYPLEEAILLNVNVPAIAEEDICGTVITRLGIRRYKDLFEKRIDPRGKTYYWLSGVVVEEEAEADTDIQAIRDNYITITPLKYDLTLAPAIPFLKTWTDKV
ncbi:5'/3'-nucleotidase SurE [Pseudanabaena sp. FACHB-1998]|uniref:5'/3'-nucleotidase SurE n=1 Tax=Pseudanabaena sp. FACHB-1998 TaxID=2692858 RepID=UPI0016806BA5|nr:5'/3'-nucleotidase SurE [Pseudanabaena sp. FACHB-1998]MBD2175490.1 5'/3'-nucleotidase SurE [Pseudanabaena sp. FACHB-1998]